MTNPELDRFWDSIQDLFYEKYGEHKLGRYQFNHTKDTDYIDDRLQSLKSQIESNLSQQKIKLRMFRDGDKSIYLPHPKTPEPQTPQQNPNELQKELSQLRPIVQALRGITKDDYSKTDVYKAWYEIKSILASSDKNVSSEVKQ